MADGDLLDSILALAARDLLQRRLVREIVIPNPAAGADWAAITPGGTIWELLSAAGQLTTSGIVANRGARIAITDSNGVRVGRVPLTTNQTASSVFQYLFSDTIANIPGGSSATVIGAIPSRLLLPAWSVASDTSALDAGDQWANVVLTVRVWSEDEVLRNCMEIGEHFEALLERRFR